MCGSVRFLRFLKAFASDSLPKPNKTSLDTSCFVFLPLVSVPRCAITTSFVVSFTNVEMSLPDKFGLTLQFPNGLLGTFIDMPWWLGGKLN